MKRTVIFGAGKQGNILYYTLPHQFQVVCFVDNRVPYGSCQTNQGLPVYNPIELLEKKNWDIVVISVKSAIGCMCGQLTALGLKYGEDFLTPYDVAYDSGLIDASVYVDKDVVTFFSQVKKLANGRKIAFVYGNCQTEVICHLLSGTSMFFGEYLIIKLPPIFYENCEKTIRFVMESGVWNQCDLFITQVVKKTNRFSEQLSTDYLTAKLPKSCKIIKIPNLYFKGYWPNAYDLARDDRVLTQYFGETGLFSNGDNGIDRLIKKGYTTGEIISEITQRDYFSREQLISEIESEINVFANREKEDELDISISDYMMLNYNRELLFHCFRHPSMKLITELTQCIVYYLGLSGCIYQDDNQNFHCQNYTMLLYPSVIAQLGLDESYNQMVYYPYSGLEIGISFKEYVYRYVNFMKRLKNEDKI